MSGAAGSLRQGDAGRSSVIAKAYDDDFHFMLIEIADEGFFFQAVNRKGETIDAGSLRRATADTEDRP